MLVEDIMTRKLTAISADATIAEVAAAMRNHDIGYQILQGNEVKRMGNAAFVMTPFDQRSLRARVTELLENSSS